MTKQQKNTESVQGAITLIIDFSNGVKKTFTNLPNEPLPQPLLEQHGMSVTDALDQARIRRPGLSYEFEESFDDRGARDVGVITSVDGVEADVPDQRWQVWVNQTPASELRRVMPDSVSKFGHPQVKPEDVILLKLVTASSAGYE